MEKKQIIMVGCILLVAVGGSIAFLVLYDSSPSNGEIELPELRFSLSTNASTVSHNETIKLVFTLHNVGNVTANVSQLKYVVSYYFLNPNGQGTYSYEAEYIVLTDDILVAIQPGENLTEEANVTIESPNFSEPGNYSVIAWYNLTGYLDMTTISHWDGSINSNSVTFEVVE